MKMFSQQILSQFSNLDFDIYNYILKNSEKIPYMTIRELAHEAHVSTTTVTRFCNKVKCAGFSEFKVKYKLELESIDTRPKIFDSTETLDFFQRANTDSFQKQLNEIADVIATKKHIVFMGVGNSGIIADFASRYFCNLGFFATVINNPMFHINIEMPSETIIIYLSVDGEAVRLVENADIFKKSKATIVSITNSKNSTLAKVADYNISYYIQRELSQKNSKYKVDITSQIPAMYIVETLAKLTMYKKLKEQ